MKSIITTTRNFSNSNSQESIIVYLPNSTYSPSLKEDEKNSDCCDSVLICKDFDVETEKDHVKGDNDDDVFKLLSMNFYSSRDEPKRFEDDRTLKSARSNRENALAGKTNSLASIKAKNNRSKKNLYHHFFDSDKIKKKPPLLSPKKVKQDDVGVGAKKKGKKCKMSYLENLKTDMDLPYNPLGSNKTKKSIENIFSPSKKVEPLVKYYSSFLVKKEGCGRNTNNVSKLASSDVRYSSLTRTKDAKNASTTVLAKRKSPVLKKVKNQKMLTCGNESVSPRSKEEGRDSQDALGIKKFPLTLRDQLFNTFSEMVPKAKKGFNLTLPGRNESSTASATSFGGKSSFFNTLESKRTTRDQISCSLGVKEGNMNKEAIMNRNKGSRQSQNSESSKASTSSKRLALQKVSEELPKKKSVVNKQEHVRNTGPYLFFDMPSLKIESNPTLKGVKEMKEMKEKGKTKDLGVKKVKGLELGERKKKESEEAGNANVKSKDNEYTSYRDSFLSLRS